MDEAFARAIASLRHAGQLDRCGRPIIDHLRRVAEAVPASVRNVAWLHDLRERTGIRPAELRFAGLTALEAAALDLLTHARGEDYERYICRIASARGPAGVLA